VETSLFEQLGGRPFFERLVDDFYENVQESELLRAMYPDDLTESKCHLTLFLVQYWGGPSDYMQERGHPRLRMRHAPFQITKQARDAWISAMTAALQEQRDLLSGEQYGELLSYFEMAATQMRNV
jgi:hemoglobin